MEARRVFTLWFLVGQLALVTGLANLADAPQRLASVGQATDRGVT